MTGRQLTTSSPSTVSSRRSTPWVDGCCGPMLMCSSSRWASGGGPTWATPTSWVLVPGVPGRTSASVWVSVCAIDASRDGEIDRFGAERFGAPQRIPLPIVGQHDAAQVGMPIEADAEQVVDLAFVPVGAGDARGDAG